MNPRPDLSSPDLFADAIEVFWGRRQRQREEQEARGTHDQGSRCDVTGGAHMDGFVSTVKTLLVGAGIPEQCIHTKRRVDLPGYFRATKQWDLIVTHERSGLKELVAVIEFKSHVGSFANNFNNRTEETLGASLDIKTAYREGLFAPSPSPWIGYMMVLQDCPKVRSPVRVSSSHFPVLPELQGASYQQRYRHLCLKMVREQCYTAACLLLTKNDREPGDPPYTEVDPELSASWFVASLLSHVEAAFSRGAG